MTLKKLLGLANKIENKELRKKVIDLLKHPSLSNKKFKYQVLSIKDAPASVQWHHTQKGGLIQHTLAVTFSCLQVAEIVEKTYKIPIDRDSLLAAALVHDIAKLWRIKKLGKTWQTSDLILDHTILGTAELYARGFPESVVHIVASHFGEQGPTPPQTIEAVILHYIDSLDAVVGTQKQAQSLVYLLG